MKFAKSLLRNEIPEWSQYYIDYKGLKKLVNQAALELSKVAGPQPTQETVGASLDPSVDDRITAPFFFAIDRQVEIVDNFYNSKFAEYTRRLRHVAQQIHLLWQQLAQDETEESEKDEMAGMLLELRSHLRNLHWYAEVNKRGFTKILKKFDKKIGTRAKSYYLSSKILILGFSNGQEIADKVVEISQMLKDIAPHLGEQKSDRPGYQRSGSALGLHANSSETSLDSPFDQLRLAVDRNDAQQVREIIETTALNSKQVLMLVLRAVSVHADSVIPVLAEPHAAQLANGMVDINRRNVVHKAVIAEGRRVAEYSAKKREIDVGVPVKQHKLDASVVASISEKTDMHYESARSLSVLVQALSRRTPVANLLLSVDLQLRAPLHYAARYGLSGTVKLLLSLEPSALTFSDADGQTPLDLAVINKHPVTLKEILAYRPPKSPELLLTASRLDSPKVCEALIAGGYDINYQSPSGETALHLATKHAHVATVKLLISRNADLEIREKTFEWTPLFVAAVDGSEEIALLLLEAGAQAEILDQSGWSAKEHAALRGHLALAKRLPSPKITLPESANMSPSPPEVESNSTMRTNSLKKPVDTTLLKTFGHRFLENGEYLVLVTMGSRDLRKKSQLPVHLDTVPMTEAGKTQLDTALSLVVSATHTQGEAFPIDLPVSELGLATEPLPFFTHEIEKLQLVFDLVPTYSAGSNVLARGVFIPPSLGHMSDLNATVHTIPIIEASSLRVLGEVNFEYLVVKPFVHPQNGFNVSTTYWRSLITTRVIGHRGLGKNTLEKSSLQLGENTVESFIQAANLGASYVEFDVQLTKDDVPVIYHDFLVGDSGFDVPMHAMTFDQFMNIQRPVRGRSDHKKQDPPTPPTVPHDLQPKRSRSVHQFRSSEEADEHYDDAVQRMRYTRDFQKKGFKGNVRGLHIQSKFATLEELFRTLPVGLGFNIEFKYPMPDEAENEEMDGTIVEVNHFVDTILKVIYDNKRERDIILTSFNPDVCILLSLKQPSIPVLFLTESGTETMYDVRASSLQEAIRFSRRFNLLGIVSGAMPLIMCPRLVRAVKENGLVCFTYGSDNNVPENARVQLKAGVDAVIVDSVLAIREELRRTQTDRDDVLAAEVSNALK